MKAPDFWQVDGPIPRLLEPLSALYSAAGAWRLARGTPHKAAVPVICVGNVVAGGAGKTPLALDLLRRLPGAQALLRGYGGSEPGPLRVDPLCHDFHAVGDEALLLAQAAPTWIARDRAAGASAAVADGARLLVMDDGFQNPSLHKDFTFVVIDGASGLGNGRVMPGGPLREPLKRALARLAPLQAGQPARGAVVIMGDDSTGISRRIPPIIPTLFADLTPAAQARAFAGRKVVAFAGIGRPAKFFSTLRMAGAQVVASHPFADHHPYDASDIQPILDEAFALGAVPVTTAKDAVRLNPDQRQQVDVLEVTAHWRDPSLVAALLAPVIGALYPSLPSPSAAG
jgi:tetraacyldisaccharide 4'-kinase